MKIDDEPITEKYISEQEKIFASKDMREGIKANFHKNTPQFSGM